MTAILCWAYQAPKDHGDTKKMSTKPLGTKRMETGFLHCAQGHDRRQQAQIEIQGISSK